MKKIDGVKALGLVATIGGVALSLLSDFVEDKKMDAKIEKKVRKALAEAKGN